MNEDFAKPPAGKLSRLETGFTREHIRCRIWTQSLNEQLRQLFPPALARIPTSILYLTMRPRQLSVIRQRYNGEIAGERNSKQQGCGAGMPRRGSFNQGKTGWGNPQVPLMKMVSWSICYPAENSAAVRLLLCQVFFRSHSRG